jgi:hypothetical protein
MVKKDLKPVKLSKEYTKTKENSQKLKKYLMEKKQSSAKKI